MKERPLTMGRPFRQVVVVSAMGAHPSSPVKVTDLLLNMVAKAQRQDEAFLLDLAALQVLDVGFSRVGGIPIGVYGPALELQLMVASKSPPR